MWLWCLERVFRNPPRAEKYYVERYLDKHLPKILLFATAYLKKDELKQGSFWELLIDSVKGRLTGGVYQVFGRFDRQRRTVTWA